MTYKRRPLAVRGEKLGITAPVGPVVRTHQADNSWDQPYNLRLTRMFACHLYVVLCILRVGGPEYLFEYICKCHDRGTIEFISEFGSQRKEEIIYLQVVRVFSSRKRYFGFTVLRVWLEMH